MDSEFLPFYIKLIPVIFSFAGLFSSLLLYSNSLFIYHLTKLQMNSVIKEVHFFFIKKWYFDILYNNFIASFVFKVGSWFYSLGDQGVLELFGPQGLFHWLSAMSPMKSLDTTMQYNLILTSVSILFFLFFGFIM